jgi:hypothetical protein
VTVPSRLTVWLTTTNPLVGTVLTTSKCAI